MERIKELMQKYEMSETQFLGIFLIGVNRTALLDLMHNDVDSAALMTELRLDILKMLEEKTK